MEGTRLGPYQLVGELGSGGMGNVFRAEVVATTSGLETGSAVALKVIHAHLLETPGFFKRFLREADLGRPADVTTPTCGVEREEITADVRTAVEELEPEARRIVELRSYEGLSFGEIAEITGLSGKDAARDRYRRALRKMGKLLERHRG